MITAQTTVRRHPSLLGTEAIGQGHLRRKVSPDTTTETGRIP
jgi:hypothetical protein